MRKKDDRMWRQEDEEEKSNENEMLERNWCLVSSNDLSFYFENIVNLWIKLSSDNDNYIN